MNVHSIVLLLVSDTGIWSLAILSLIGTVFNVLKHRAGFGIWIVTNTGWIVVNLEKKIPAQAVLFAAYLVVSVWGFVAWKKTKEKEA